MKMTWLVRRRAGAVSRNKCRRKACCAILVTAGVGVAAVIMHRDAEPRPCRSLTTGPFAGSAVYDGDLLWRNDDTFSSAPHQRFHGPSPRARAVRIGAMMVEVETAARVRNMASHGAYYSRDPAAVRVVNSTSAVVADRSRMMMMEVRALDDDAPILSWLGQLAELGDRRATFGGELRMVGIVIRDLPYPELITLGSWLQAGRFAAQLGDIGYFRTPASQAAANCAASLRKIHPAARVALDRLGGLDTNPLADVRSYESVVTAALHELTK